MNLVDCDITEVGISQAELAGKQLSKEIEGKIDLVVVSPLRRALQTAALVLEHFEGNTTAPKIEISNLVTEVLEDSCDIGSSPKILSMEYPEWSFAHLQDHWWHGGKNQAETLESVVDGKGRESDDDVLLRLSELKRFLRDQLQHHETIVIVCHSMTIWWLTQELKNGERSGIMTKNCQIVDVTDHVNI